MRDRTIEGKSKIKDYKSNAGSWLQLEENKLKNIQKLPQWLFSLTHLYYQLLLFLPLIFKLHGVKITILFSSKWTHKVMVLIHCFSSNAQWWCLHHIINVNKITISIKLFDFDWWTSYCTYRYSQSCLPSHGQWWYSHLKQASKHTNIFLSSIS